MEETMKKYKESERRTHVDNWKKSELSKAAYAKSAGIVPTTFYTWFHEADTTKQGFVDINQRITAENDQEMIIEKDTFSIRLPLTIGKKELQTIFGVLGELS
jgi:hypothetical protein